MKPLRIVLLGADGQVGSELSTTLAPLGAIRQSTLQTLDVSKPDALRSFLRAEEADVWVNATAWTDVDGAEKNPDVARAVNRDAVAVMGEEARRAKLGLIHISTDFVFDGKGERPYVETDVAAPINLYGLTKREGELALLELDAPAITLRTAWVYSLARKSFVSVMRKLAKDNETLRAVSDQTGNPTWARELAVSIALLTRTLQGSPESLFEATRSTRGIYHLASEGSATRQQVVEAILRLDPTRTEFKAREVKPALTSDFPAPAQRPHYTVLSCEKFRGTFGFGMAAWDDSLARALRSNERFV